MLSGGLIAFAISMALFLNSMHHMFIVRTSSPIGIVAHAIPAILLIAGILIGVRALKR